MKKICTILSFLILITLSLGIVTAQTPKKKAITGAKVQPTKDVKPVVVPAAQPQVQPAVVIPSVKIGEQTWMTSNLAVTNFANGDKIDQVQSNEEWVKAGAEMRPAWCYFENDAEKGKIYGVLYNYYAIQDPRGLAPKGWHIASKYEWLPMLDVLGGKGTSGNKLKSKTLWSPIADVDRNGYDSLGFNMLPGGLRFGADGTFGMLGERAQIWTSTENNSAAGAMIVFGITKDVDVAIAGKAFGYSTRCIKD